MTEPFIFPLTGGMNRSVLPTKADRADFWLLENFRQHRSTVGKVEQTPFFKLFGTYNQGTYWNGSAGTTEASDSTVILLRTYFAMTEFVFWNSNAGASSTQIHAYYQTASGVESIYTGCRLDINTMPLGVNLGATLDVEMTGAAAGRYRINGGGWTAFVPSTQGVSILAGVATLYFLANTGFAGTETWSWTRTDRSSEGATYINTTVPINSVFYEGALYFVTQDARVMIVRADSVGVLYVTSLGYRPVYGTYLCTFDDHLIVGRFARTIGFYNAADRINVLAWSDKTDLFNFIPTDTNEADQITLSCDCLDTTIGAASAGVVGLAVFGRQLHVYMPHGFHTTPALGLPLVFSFGFDGFTELNDGSLGQVVLPTEDGAYLFGPTGLYRMTLSGVEEVSVAVKAVVSTFQMTKVFYSSTTRELTFFDGTFLYVYQECYKKWHRRAASFDHVFGCFYIANGVIYIGQETRQIIVEDLTGNGTPLKDVNAGVSWATPKITLFPASQSLWKVEDINAVFLAASVTTAAGSSYSTDANCQFKLYWYKTLTGDITGNPTSDAASVWVNTSTNGQISTPGLNGRAVAFEIQLVGLTADKPPAFATVSGFETDTREPSTVRK